MSTWVFSPQKEEQLKYDILKKLYLKEKQIWKNEKEYYEHVIEDLKHSIDILLTSYMKEQSVIPHLQTLLDKIN